MTLVLRIENFDQFDSGGPTWLQLDGNGASVGRRAAMDWTLPDPSKMISGHHFDITFENGQYFLSDVSMNGTFVDGQRHRIEGKLPLRGGERLIVGHYIIAVELHQSAQPSGGMGSHPDESDPWDAFGPADPVNVHPPRKTGGPGMLEDLGGGFIPVQRPSFEAGLKTETSLQLPMHTRGQAQTPPAGGYPGVSGHEQPPEPYVPTLGQEPGGASDRPPDVPEYVPTLGQEPSKPPPDQPAYTPTLGQEPSKPPPDQPAYTPNLGQEPSRSPIASVPPPVGAAEHARAPAPPPGPEPERSVFPRPGPAPRPEPSRIPMPRPSPPQAAAPAPQPQPYPQQQPQTPAPEPSRPAPPAQEAPKSGGESQALLRAFCEGAGLDPNSVRPEDQLRLMHMMGRCARVATEEIMAMLKARTDVKKFTGGGQRTMLSANANNPMKFMPDSQQALEVMFVSPRDGFMTGADSFKDALTDIRVHQAAIFRALQPALAEVFAGLSPEEIEEACEDTGRNLLGVKSTAKHWEKYVERFDEKAQAGEHGLLDAFLQAFARAYAEASARS